MSRDVLFLENRRTPKIVKKGESYEPTEAEGKIKSRRAATEEEEKTISRGDWVRVNEHGDKPGDPGYKRKKSKVRPNPNQNALTAAAYEGVTHAGVALVAADCGMVLMAQRAYDETDDEMVRETYEFPGGGLAAGEEPWAGALREFEEEVRMSFPEAEVVNGWRSDCYQGFVAVVPTMFDLSGFEPNPEVQAVAWVDMADTDLPMRPELDDFDLSLIDVSEKQENPMDTPLAAAQVGTADEYIQEPAPQGEGVPIEDDEPAYSADSFDLDGPIPVHGVIAPEEMSSGDKRAFGKGAMTRRPLALPFRDAASDVGGHDGAVTVGRVDRMMRKGGMIHWEGSLMDSAVAEPLVERMQFFDGRYGVSVDGDQGNLDEARTEETGTVWFDQIRAAGLTAVAIPAFHEAYVAFGAHPEMPADETLAASAYAAGDMIGAQSAQFKRGPGWITNPTETNRIHDYWTKKGEPGYAKVGWGTRGDFTRAKRLIGAKIAEHSPDKMRFLNQIIAQWHFDALGYWPGDLDMPGNKTSAEAKAERSALAVEPVNHIALADRLDEEGDNEGIAVVEAEEETAVWETVLVSSAGVTVKPPLDYFHQYTGEDAALTIEEPDALGIRRVHGYAAQWGVCHVGMQGRCVEPPRTYSDDYSAFHLGVTHTDQGKVYTGVLTYGVGHRDAETILSESPEAAYFDNVNNAWAAVRVGENDEGIWFSGYVLPGVPEEHLTLIQASGQVSGEWLGPEMRACLTVNVPGFAVERPSVVYDEAGNVMALAASAFGQGEIECIENDRGTEQDEALLDSLTAAVMERIAARAKMDAARSEEARARMARVRMSVMREEF